MRMRCGVEVKIVVGAVLLWRPLLFMVRMGFVVIVARPVVTAPLELEIDPGKEVDELPNSNIDARRMA